MSNHEAMTPDAHPSRPPAPQRDPSLPSLLLVEDDAGLSRQLKWALARRYTVHLASNRADALAMVRRHEPPLVVLDLGLPPDASGATEGLAALSEILAYRPATKVIVSSGHQDHAHALEAVRRGAYDFYPKPVDLDSLGLILDRARHLHDLEEENRRLAAQPPDQALSGVIAESAAMQDVCRIIERVAPSTVGVLITGKSGTGKEVLARALHTLSDRRDGPFVAINCAAIPENLLESELFGHEKGAFTGAVARSIGKVEQADGGTLFLDEIGDMPLGLQVKLLRFLQERVIERLGGHGTIAVDVRVVAATNQDLAARIADGSFREDLYYRLDEVGVTAPPLRDRPGDAPLLARHFLDRYARALDRPVKRFSAEALAAIADYAWPGNVRELENRVKRAVVMADGTAVQPSDLGLSAATTLPTLRRARERAEYDAVTQALAMSNGNVSAAAKLLGISRPTLYDLMKALKVRTT